MNFITEISGEIVIVLLCGIVFSFIVWKMRGTKLAFGDFLDRYGEIFAYAGLLLILFIIAIIQWRTR